MFATPLLMVKLGLYGFDVRGPSSFPVLQMHYWSNVLNILRNKVGAEVIVTSVPPCVFRDVVFQRLAKLRCCLRSAQAPSSSAPKTCTNF